MDHREEIEKKKKRRGKQGSIKNKYQEMVLLKYMAWRLAFQFVQWVIWPACRSESWDGILISHGEDLPSAEPCPGPCGQAECPVLYTAVGHCRCLATWFWESLSNCYFTPSIILTCCPKGLNTYPFLYKTNEWMVGSSSHYHIISKFIFMHKIPTMSLRVHYNSLDPWI